MGANGRLTWVCDRCGLETQIDVELPSEDSTVFAWELPMPDGWERTYPSTYSAVTDAAKAEAAAQSFCARCWLAEQIEGLLERVDELAGERKALEDCDANDS